MTDADLNKAIEVAEEAVAGFADDDSFEQLLALAVLELRDRLNNERVTVAGLWALHDSISLASNSNNIRAREKE